jgi:hypothetical protein
MKADILKEVIIKFRKATFWKILLKDVHPSRIEAVQDLIIQFWTLASSKLFDRGFEEGKKECGKDIETFFRNYSDREQLRKRVARYFLKK